MSVIYQEWRGSVLQFMLWWIRWKLKSQLRQWIPPNTKPLGKQEKWYVYFFFPCVPLNYISLNIEKPFIVFTSVFKNTRWKKYMYLRIICMKNPMLLWKNTFSFFMDAEKGINILVISKLANGCVTNYIFKSFVLTHRTSEVMMRKKMSILAHIQGNVFFYVGRVASLKLINVLLIVILINIKMILILDSMNFFFF